MLLSEAYSELCQKYMMELFAKIIKDWKPSTVSTRRSALDVWQGSKYAPDISNMNIYNYVHNILRHFDRWANLLFTTMQVKRSVIISNKYGIRVPSRVAERLKTYDLRKLGNIRKILRFHRIIAQCPVLVPKWSFFVNIRKKLLKKRN